MDNDTSPIALRRLTHARSFIVINDTVRARNELYELTLQDLRQLAAGYSRTAYLYDPDKDPEALNILSDTDLIIEPSEAGWYWAEKTYILLSGFKSQSGETFFIYSHKGEFNSEPISHTSESEALITAIVDAICIEVSDQDHYFQRDQNWIQIPEPPAGIIQIEENQR